MKDPTPLNKRFFVILNNVVRHPYSRMKEPPTIRKGISDNKRWVPSDIKYLYTARELIDLEKFSPSIIARISKCRVDTIIQTGFHKPTIQRVSPASAQMIRDYEYSEDMANTELGRINKEISKRCSDLLEEKKRKEQARERSRKDLEEFANKTFGRSVQKKVKKRVAKKKKITRAKKKTTKKNSGWALPFGYGLGM